MEPFHGESFTLLQHSGGSSPGGRSPVNWPTGIPYSPVPSGSFAVLTAAASLTGGVMGAALTEAALTGAALPGAALTGAALPGAALTGAALTGAALTGAALTGAALTGESNERCSRLTGAAFVGLSSCRPSCPPSCRPSCPPGALCGRSDCWSSCGRDGFCASRGSGTRAFREFFLPASPEEELRGVGDGVAFLRRPSASCPFRSLDVAPALLAVADSVLLSAEGPVPTEGDWRVTK